MQRFRELYHGLLYLWVNTRAVIGQFSVPYSPARPAKIKSVFVEKLLRDLSPNFLNL